MRTEAADLLIFKPSAAFADGLKNSMRSEAILFLIFMDPSCFWCVFEISMRSKGNSILTIPGCKCLYFSKATMAGVNLILSCLIFLRSNLILDFGSKNCLWTPKAIFIENKSNFICLNIEEKLPHDFRAFYFLPEPQQTWMRAITYMKGMHFQSGTIFNRPVTTIDLELFVFSK